MLEYGSALPVYRAYYLGRNGRIVAAEVIPADNDEDARAFADTLRADHQIEVWERGRRLAVYPPREVALGTDR